MTKEILFYICNAVALCGWLLLIFAPRWKWSARGIAACIVPTLLSIAYISLILMYSGESQGGFFSLEEVSLIFQNQHIVLACWIHYMVFDLFVGCWITRDAQKINVSHLLVIPCLIATCLYGPFGLTLYFLIRWIGKRTFFIED